MAEEDRPRGPSSFRLSARVEKDVILREPALLPSVVLKLKPDHNGTGCVLCNAGLARAKVSDQKGKAHSRCDEGHSEPRPWLDGTHGRNRENGGRGESRNDASGHHPLSARGCIRHWENEGRSRAHDSHRP